MKFTVGIRDQISAKYRTYTFGAQYDVLAMNENKLAREVYNTIYPKKDRDLMATLPNGWLPERDHIEVNASGYHVNLYLFKMPIIKTTSYGFGYYSYQMYYEAETVRFPNSARRFNLQYDKHAELIQKVQAHVNNVKKLDENKKNFSHKMASFLKPITTDTKFKELMPEWETVLGKDFFGTTVTPTTALTTTAAEIMCVVAQGRGEKRDGCCDGKVISL